MNSSIITYKLHQRYLKMFVTASIQLLICQTRNSVLYKRIIDTKKKLILKHNILQKIILFCRNIFKQIKYKITSCKSCLSCDIFKEHLIWKAKSSAWHGNFNIPFTRIEIRARWDYQPNFLWDSGQLVKRQ